MQALRQALGDGVTFHDQQFEAIEAVALHRHRALVVQRTGWGKSIVYFIATRLLRDQGAGPTIIVSPLLALMRDQIGAAKRLGLVAETINSSNNDDWERIESSLQRDEVDLLLISPERLNNPAFRERMLNQLTAAAGLLVVDEAHCISDWGHDFRPDYRRIAKVVRQMPPGVPVLCTTATANDRVIGDITGQLGSDMTVLRGPLDRESLSLGVLSIDSPSERLAWLAEWVRNAHGTGIVYCLTIADTERVSSWLNVQGIPAVAYSGATEPATRIEIEDQLKRNEVKVVAATSALGMGFDKPDLAFVVHFQSPDSPVAYYQQVGRAGRAIDHAEAILLVGTEDHDIWTYFLETSLPAQAHAEEVVEFLAESMEWHSLGEIEQRVNASRGRLAALLKVLEVEGAVEFHRSKYRRSLAPWSFDAERIERVRTARLAEQQLMRDYSTTVTCRMQFIRAVLNDAVTDECGRCDNCRGLALDPHVDREAIQSAIDFVRTRPVTIEPRRQWMGARAGRIPADVQLRPGRALGYVSDPGWGRQLTDTKRAGQNVSNELVAAAASLVGSWMPGFAGTVVPVPSNDPARMLVPDFARRLAAELGLPFSECVRKVRTTQLQNVMENSALQLRNVDGAFDLVGSVPDGPILLVDDVADSRWTMTVVGEVLAKHGATEVIPFALAKTKG